MLFYRQLIANELKNRKGRNPNYSMRAFAKYLGVPPSLLFRILNNQSTLTFLTAAKIIDRLALNGQDTTAFLHSLLEEGRQQASRNRRRPKETAIAPSQSLAREEKESP